MRHSEVLAKIINENKYKRIAELGVYKGSTTKYLLRSCPSITSYYAIDNWDVYTNTEEVNWGRMGRRTAEDWINMYNGVCVIYPYCEQLKVIRMDIIKAAEQLFPVKRFKGFFDFVYIDASHFYENTLNEIKTWLPLVRKGGIIGGHDYATGAHKGHQVDKAVDEIFGKGNVDLYDDGVWIRRV